MLSFLGADEVKGIDGANAMALPHERNDKQPSSNLDERHGAVRPRKANLGDPLLYVEGDGQSKPDAERIEHNGRLFNVVREALGEVVDGDGGDAQGAKGDEDLGEAQEAPRHLLVQAVAEDAQADGVADEGGEPEGMKAVLGSPVAVAKTLGDPEGDAVGDELAVREGK
jgi:hypothetical protein